MRLTERQLGSYHITYTVAEISTEVEIHEIDMGGWVLYECFILPEYSIIQIISDHESLHLFEEENDPELLIHANAILSQLRSRMLYHPN